MKEFLINPNRIWLPWRDDLKNITESFENIHKDDVNTGISSKDFSNKLVEQVELFLDNIQYFIEVLHHLKNILFKNILRTSTVKNIILFRTK